MRTPDPGSCSWRSRPLREPDRSMAASNVNGGRAPRRYRFGIRARTHCGMAVLLAVLLATPALLIVDSWTRLRVARGAEATNHAAGELITVALGLAAATGIPIGSTNTHLNAN